MTLAEMPSLVQRAQSGARYYIIFIVFIKQPKMSIGFKIR